MADPQTDNYFDVSETGTPKRPSTAKLHPLMRIIPFVLRYQKMLIGSLIALITATLATLALPIAARFMIDYGFNIENPRIDQYFLAMLVVAVILGIASATRFYFVTLIGERVTADMRQAVYEHLTTLTPSFFEQTRTGEVISRLTADTTLIRIVLASSASVAVRNIFLFIGAAIMLVYTDRVLSGLAVLILPAIIIPVLGFGRLVRILARKSQDRLADTSAHAVETITAMPLVQAFTHEAYDNQYFSEAIEESFRAAKHRIIARAALTAIAIVLAFAGVVGILWIGAQYVLEGEMSPGQLGQFILYAVLCATALGSLSEVWGDVQQAAGAAERLTELLEIKPDIVPPKNPVPIPFPTSGAITFVNVDFHYPMRCKKQVLKKISFSATPGDTIALVGPSGAGKSTLFQLICRFYDPKNGHIEMDGIPIKKCAPHDIRRNIAWVPQETIIFNMSVEDNIRFGNPQANDKDIKVAAHTANADEFINDLPEGYQTQLGERGASLSGGQRQRIAIARAVLRNAPILLLDEATSALDATSETLVQEAIARLMTHGARTTIVIAHRLATVLNADRIIVMDEGKIIESGTHNELIKTCDLYRNLAELQFTTTHNQ